MYNQSTTALLVFSTIALSSVSACSSELSPDDAALLEERVAREAAENKQPDSLMEIAEANADLSTLRLVADASGVSEQLKGQGPFTGFAPTNEAFEKLGKDRLSELLTPGKKSELGKTLMFHIVPGSLLKADIVKAIDEGGGTALFPSEQGEKIKATRVGENIILEDGKGNKATIISESKAKNGVLFKVDNVLIPE